MRAADESENPVLHLVGGQSRTVRRRTSPDRLTRTIPRDTSPTNAVCSTRLAPPANIATS